MGVSVNCKILKFKYLNLVVKIFKASVLYNDNLNELHIPVNEDYKLQSLWIKILQYMIPFWSLEAFNVLTENNRITLWEEINFVCCFPNIRTESMTMMTLTSIEVIAFHFE